MRRWRAANPEKAREQKRRYRERDPERYRQLNRAAARRWRAANPGKAREQDRRRRAAHPERLHNGLLRRQHGLYPEQWEALRAAQDGLCYLCGDLLPDDPSEVSIDHDHRCCPSGFSCRSCRRGLAHDQCNTLIGLAGDDPARLRRIAANLAQAQRRIGRLPRPLTLFDLEDT
jgi:hypothetical protein